MKKLFLLTLFSLSLIGCNVTNKPNGDEWLKSCIKQFEVNHYYKPLGYSDFIKVNEVNEDKEYDYYLLSIYSEYETQDFLIKYNTETKDYTVTTLQY